MHAFEKETNLIIDALEGAYLKIKEVNNPDMEWLQKKILMDIKRHADALRLQLGIEPDFDKAVVKQHPGPLTRMFGVDITPNKGRARDVNKPFKQTAEDVAAAELKVKAQELMPKFLATDSDQLLDSVTDIEIRAIATLAGLPVTETKPDRITTAYIDEIKAALREQNDGKALDDELDPDLNKIIINQQDVQDQLFANFSTFENKEILEVYTDPQIRSVAKRAGLPVTDLTPAKIDSRFVTQIKNALKKQKELNDIAGNV